MCSALRKSVRSMSTCYWCRSYAYCLCSGFADHIDPGPYLLSCPMQNEATEQIQERTERVVADLKEKWDKTEEKPAFLGLTAASFVAIYVLNGVVDALEGVPLFSGLFKLIGIFVSSWFVYRYLVFAPGESLYWYLRSPALQHSPSQASRTFLCCRSRGASAEHQVILQEGWREGLACTTQISHA
jgi:hypothetical protein